MVRRRWAIAIALAILVIGVLVATIFTRRAEPRYGGRTLSAWLDDLRPAIMPWTPRAVRTATAAGPYSPRIRRIAPAALTQEEARVEKAAAAVRAIGTNAIPHLLALVYSRDNSLKMKLTALIRKQAVLKIPIKTAADLEAQGLSGLVELGPDAMWAWINVLTNRLSSSIAQSYAWQHLRIYDGDATSVLPALHTLLAHRSPLMREAVRRSVDPGGFILLLYDLEHSPEPNARAGAAWSLGFSHERPETSVPALMKALNDESARPREAAVEALGKFGVQALSATNAICRAMDDPDRRVRIAATNALHQVLGASLTN